MLDDLRKDALEHDFEEFEDDDDDMLIEETTTRNTRFLGMTAVERMFLSIFFFLNVLVLGLAILIVTQRIVL